MNRSLSPEEERKLISELVERGLLSEEDAGYVQRLRRETHRPLEKILVATGMVRRYDLYKVLADIWGLPFVDLLKTPPDERFVRRFSPEELSSKKFIPMRLEDDGSLAVATAWLPGGEVFSAVRRKFGNTPLRFYITTDWDIDRTVNRIFVDEIHDLAVHRLYYLQPLSSAYTIFTEGQFFAFAALLVGLLAGLYFYTRPTLILLNLLVNVAFLANVLFKFVVSFVGAGAEQWEAVSDEEVRSLDDASLPTYTILVPVYKEAKVVRHLLDNLARLDYPPEKLDVIVLLEEDDEETIEAVKKSRPPGNVTLGVIPNGIPKTKPKACNVGLFFARGEYLVIYDAEDRPEPDQLKKAVMAFRKGPENLVCVQAALNYYNARENALTRLFTMEYSYWFDYMLPGLYRLGLPIPLGGTSNHFKTAMLKEIGGWDPFNVTEDADLGVRAAAFGYVVGIINSTTYEEANKSLKNWIRQRSRWIKGYMQTSLVHLRNPIGLVKVLGLRKTLGFLLLVAGTPLAFLANPWMWAMYIVWLFTGTQKLRFLFPPAITYISLFNLLLGNGIAIYLNMLAVFKRKYYDLILWALLNPLYWILHSIAAYKALYQLFTRPFFWEKTEHGISSLFEGDARA